MKGSRLKSAEQSLYFESCAAAGSEPGSDADAEDLKATGQAFPIQELMRSVACGNNGGCLTLQGRP